MIDQNMKKCLKVMKSNNKGGERIRNEMADR